MGYSRLRARLARGLDGRDIITLPDGSIDRYFQVFDSGGERVQTRSAFVEKFAEAGVRSLQLRPESVQTGGQAVNSASQVAALDHSVTLYGHLDDARMGPFPFTAVSMGPPATVHILSFHRHELMLSVESQAIRNWGLNSLFEVIDGPADSWLSDQILVIQNWAGFPGMTEALTELADLDLGNSTILFDPGSIAGCPPDPLRDLTRAIEALGTSVSLVLTANETELTRMAGVLGLDTTGTSRESSLRTALDIEAVIRHDVDRAVAATGSITSVKNFDARRIARRTGAGDRFNGGLAVGLAADLPWTDSLALGNTCATYFVEQGSTGSRADLTRLLESRSLEP